MISEQETINETIDNSWNYKISKKKGKPIETCIKYTKDNPLKIKGFLYKLDPISRYACFFKYIIENESILNNNTFKNKCASEFNYFHNIDKINEKIYSLSWIAIDIEKVHSMKVKSWYNIEFYWEGKSIYTNFIEIECEEIPKYIITSSMIRLISNGNVINYKKLFKNINSIDNNKKYILMKREGITPQFRTLGGVLNRIIELKDNKIFEDYFKIVQDENKFIFEKNHLFNNLFLELLKDIKNNGNINNAVLKWLYFLQNNLKLWGYHSLEIMVNQSKDSNSGIRNYTLNLLKKYKINDIKDLLIFCPVLNTVKSKDIVHKLLNIVVDKVIKNEISITKQEIFKFMIENNPVDNFYNSLPGGGQDLDEDFLQTALREMVEETGYDLQGEINKQVNKKPVYKNATEINECKIEGFEIRCSNDNYFKEDQEFKFFEIIFNIPCTKPPAQIPLYNELLNLEKYNWNEFKLNRNSNNYDIHRNFNIKGSRNNEVPFWIEIDNELQVVAETNNNITKRYENVGESKCILENINLKNYNFTLKL